MIEYLAIQIPRLVALQRGLMNDQRKRLKFNFPLKI